MDVSAEALLLLQAMQVHNEAVGLSQPINFLRGSKSKYVTEARMKVLGRDGKPLFGAGARRNVAWWKVRPAPFLTPREAHRQCRTSPPTIHRWVGGGM